MDSSEILEPVVLGQNEDDSVVSIAPARMNLHHIGIPSRLLKETVFNDFFILDSTHASFKIHQVFYKKSFASVRINGHHNY